MDSNVVIAKSASHRHARENARHPSRKYIGAITPLPSESPQLSTVLVTTATPNQIQSHEKEKKTWPLTYHPPTKWPYTFWPCKSYCGAFDQGANKPQPITQLTDSSHPWPYSSVSIELKHIGAPCRRVPESSVRILISNRSQRRAAAVQVRFHLYARCACGP